MFPVKIFPKHKMFQIFFATSQICCINLKKTTFGVIALIRKGKYEGLIAPKPDFFYEYFLKSFFQGKLTDKNSYYFQ